MFIPHRRHRVEHLADGSIRFVASNLYASLLLSLGLGAALVAVGAGLSVLTDGRYGWSWLKPTIYVALMWLVQNRTRRIVELDASQRELRVTLEQRVFPWRARRFECWRARFDELESIDRVSFGPGEDRSGAFDIVARLDGEQRFVAKVAGSFANQSLVETLRELVAPEQPDLGELPDEHRSLQ